MKEWNNNPKIKKRKEKWEKEHKWKRKLRRISRRILKRTKEFVPINLLREIFERDDYTCQYCGSKRDLSIDHKKAIANGGSNTKSNLLVACITCNALKSDMSVKEFKKKYSIKHIASRGRNNKVGLHFKNDLVKEGRK